LNALITACSIAVVAAATAGLLIAVGVGDDDSRSNGDAEARENRINRVAERLAADIVEQSPDTCNFINRSLPIKETNVFEVVVFGVSEPEYFARLSGRQRAAVSARLTEKLQTECEGRGD
jgi:hypothetical protein